MTSEHRGRLEHLASAIAQAVETPIDEGPHTGGRDRCERTRQIALTVELLRFLLELAEKLAEEVGIATRDLLQGDRRVDDLGHGFRGRRRADQRAHLVVPEAVERHGRRACSRREPFDQLCTFADELIVPQRRDQEEMIESGMAKEVAEQGERGAIRPVDILDHQHDRRRRQPLEGGRHRVEQLEVRTGRVRVGELADELVGSQIGEDETERGGELGSHRIFETRDERTQDLGNRLVVARGVGVAVADEGRDPVGPESQAVLLDKGRLTDAGRTHDQRGAALSGRGLVIEVDETSELGPAPDESHARPPPRRHDRHRSRCDEVERGTLQQHVFFEPAQTGRRREAELVVEATGELGIDPKRVSLTVAAIQRAHQTLSQAFSQRMLFECRRENVDHQCVLTQGEPYLCEFLDRDDPELLEPGDLRTRSTEIARVGERRTAPQIERRRQQGNRGAGVTTIVDLPGQHDEPFEPLDVELVGLHPQQISVRTGRKAAARCTRVAVQLEHLAQARDVHAQCGCRAGRRFALPELVDQLLRRHRPVRSHREQDEELARFGTRQRDRRPVVTDLGRTENSKLHWRPRALQPEPTVHRRAGGGTGPVYRPFTALP